MRPNTFSLRAGTLLPFLLLGSASCGPALRAPATAHAKPASTSVTFVARYEAPIGGTKGDVLEIAVTGFSSSSPTEVRFGGIEAVVSAVSGKSLEVVVPPGAGTVDVTLSNGGVSWVLVGAFRYRT